MTTGKYSEVVVLIRYCEEGLRKALDEKLGQFTTDRYTVLKAATNMAAALTSEECEAVMSMLMLETWPHKKRGIIKALAEDRIADVIKSD